MTTKQLKEFFEKLEGPNGCNFRKEKGQIVWNCSCGEDRPLAHKIMKEMKISLKDQVEFMNKCYELGGHCDCEIIFNVEGRL